MNEGEYVTIVAVSPPDANGKSSFSGTSHIDLEKWLKRLARSKLKGSGLFYTKSTSTVPGSWKKEHFCRLHVAVLDDIGTKVPWDNVNDGLGSTYIIESSPDNFQLGYVLEDPIDSIEKADQFENSYISEEITDTGIKGPMHLVRLPGGFHQKTGAEVKYNGKIDCKLSATEILEVYDLAWAAPVKKQQTVQGPVESVDLDLIEDPILRWLADNDMVLEDTKDSGWTSVRCPWEDEHTDARSDTGYNGLGMGKDPMLRGFNCFHSHKKTTSEFLEWIAKQGGPECTAYDPIPFLQQNYAVIEDGSRIAATHYVPSREWAIWELKDFNMRYPQKIKLGKAMVSVAKAFVDHDFTTRYRGTTYVPSNSLDVHTANGMFYNMFSQPMHPATQDEPELFLEHCEYLIENDEERDYFYDWLATHVQTPGDRLPGILIIGGYGVGKSWLNSMIGELLGIANVSSASFQKLCNPQTYDDWLVNKQLIVVEEAKDTGDAGKYDVYENIKPLIDTRTYRNYSANMKYGKIRGADIYANFLIFSNHSTPLIVPPGDRRLFVIDGAQEQREVEYYKKIHAALEAQPCMEAAKLWFWLKKRNVTNDLKKPFMTPAKAAMIQTGKSVVDEVIEDAIDELPGAICTEYQLITYTIGKLISQNVEHTISIDKQVKHKFRDMPYVNAADPRWQMRIKGERLRPRVLRDKNKVQGMFKEGMVDELRAEVLKNGAIAQGSQVGLDIVPFKG